MNSYTYLESEGYYNLTELQSGELAGLCKFLFTIGLVVGLTDSGYRIRFCFETEKDAIDSLKAWNGSGYPSGKWIKAKGVTELGEQIDEINPNL